jgi:hypothetical protein
VGGASPMAPGAWLKLGSTLELHLGSRNQSRGIGCQC